MYSELAKQQERLAFALAIFGVWSSFDRDMFSKLFRGFSFDYWDEERPAIIFFAAMLSVIGIYVFVTYYGIKILTQLQKGGTKHYDPSGR